MAKINKKLVDSIPEISNGGRAQNYWLQRPVRRSPHYVTNHTDSDIDQLDVIKAYVIKGFEYGNWINNNDRYDRLIATNNSLSDLSIIIGSRNIGLDGKVGIAFGARGKSKALAHFEPHTFMINLTKEKGFGSLAHEYGHALDYFFGMYIDQHQSSAALSGGQSTQKTAVLEGGILRRLINQLINQVIQDKKGNLTNSYKQWQKTVGDNAEYWFRRNEIFARTFEMWVGYKCGKLGIKNNFLHKSKYDKPMYLVKKDFEEVLPLMNKLIRTMSQYMNNKI